MTVVTEYRLKCDFCGNVSPALDVPPMYSPEMVLPMGWTGKGGVMYGVSDSFTPGARMYKQHFCTLAHKEAWEKQQAERTA